MARRARQTEATATASLDAERHFAEELGSYWEDVGGTRMAGRILGALLLADPPEMSSADLVEFLGVSAGSVSTATRELIRPGLAERVRFPGDRQDYFRATFGTNVSQVLRVRMEQTIRWERLLERGKQLAAGKDPDVAANIEKIREFYEFAEMEQRALIERWDERQRSRER